MKKIVCAMAALFCLIACFSAFAAEFPAEGVALKNGNIRKTTSTKSELKGKVAKGAPVTVLSEETDKKGTVWYKIESGKTSGYILAELVSLSGDLPADGSAASAAAGTSSAGAVHSANYQKLKKGSKGEAVTALQNRLIELYYLDGSASGKFDADTQKAVKAFQKDAGLSADGAATPETQALLFSEDAWDIHYKALPALPLDTIDSAIKKSIKSLDGKKTNYHGKQAFFYVQKVSSYHGGYFTYQLGLSQEEYCSINVFLSDKPYEDDPLKLELSMGVHNRCRKSSVMRIGDENIYLSAEDLSNNVYTLSLLDHPSALQDLLDCKLVAVVMSQNPADFLTSFDEIELTSDGAGYKMSKEFVKFWKAFDGDTLLKNIRFAKAYAAHKK